MLSLVEFLEEDDGCVIVECGNGYGDDCRIVAKHTVSEPGIEDDGIVMSGVPASTANRLMVPAF